MMTHRIIGNSCEINVRKVLMVLMSKARLAEEKSHTIMQCPTISKATFVQFVNKDNKPTTTITQIRGLGRS